MMKNYYIVPTGYGYCIYCNGKPIEGSERLTREECESEMEEMK